MLDHLVARADAKTMPLTPLTTEALSEWLPLQSAAYAKWIGATEFAAEVGKICLLPSDNGGLDRALLGVNALDDLWSYAGAASGLPPGRYRIDPPLSATAATQAALGWALGCYSFDRYKKRTGMPAHLVWPKSADKAYVSLATQGIALTRDLINTPANHMGPEDLADAARVLAKQHKAKLTILVGDQLLKKGYPAVHAVGRASSRLPRLIDLTWGRKGPRVTLVGKGVCFDSGGLDLKSASGMKLMKKDMGGAAHVLGLAAMVMAAKLPVRLRVLVPAVENAVSGDAFRPLDVIETRKGLSVEIGNTDAEGRLILADALTEADRDDPTLVIDFATLTGAARVALGTDLPAMFANDDRVAEALTAAAASTQDPLWRMPLHKPYRRLLESSIADINNISDGPYGGAITAALFLAEFLRPSTPWVHFDVMAWNLAARPGRPAGGEAMALRASYAILKDLAEGRLTL